MRQMGASKYILLLGLLFTIHSEGQVKKVPEPGIHFLNKDWKSILALSKKTHKPIFVDAYTTWCVPCQEMKKSTFKDRRLANIFNSCFINVTVDVETGSGVGFADQYGVTAYPTLLFIGENGSVIKRFEGFMDARQLKAAAVNIK